MVEILIVVYLIAPVILGAAAVLYALTRAPDRLQLATLALFVASLIYFALAYEFNKQQDHSAYLPVLLGTYALFVYSCMAALALYFKRWAWRASLGIFGAHLLVGLLLSPTAMTQGAKGLLALSGYLLVGAVGLWALLHRGSRNAVNAAPGEA
jgi:hypothetical protein